VDDELSDRLLLHRFTFPAWSRARPVARIAMTSRTPASSKAASSSVDAYGIEAVRELLGQGRGHSRQGVSAPDPWGVVGVGPTDRLGIVIGRPVLWVVEGLDGHQFDPELLATLDQAEELGLVDHVPGEDRQPVLALQRHRAEAPLELIAEFSP
jgi:hypothetical protein